jgi:hypothetical protein
VSRRAQFALGSVVVSAVLTAIGTFGDDGDSEWWQWLVVVAIAVAAAAVLFWLVVPRVGDIGLWALVLAILGAVSIVVFWTGLPAVFAGAAAFLALDARGRGLKPGLATAALAVAAVTVGAAVVVAFVG